MILHSSTKKSPPEHVWKSSVNWRNYNLTVWVYLLFQQNCQFQWKSVLPSLKYWHLINGLWKFTVSISVRSVKLTQTSALTAHRARKKTIEMLGRGTLEYVGLSPLQWPPDTPDLKLVDYAIWASCRSASRLGRKTEYQLLLVKISWRDRNVKIR